MPAERPGQMLVASVLMIGLIVMSLLVTAYQTHALFLRTRSAVARETVGAITADFNRALAVLLALATRSYYDPSRFSEFVREFERYGLEPRNLSSAKQVSFRYLNTWSNVQKVVYAEYGIQISWQPGISDVSHLLAKPAYVFDLMLIVWNETISGSYICAQLHVNLTSVGFYHWVSTSLIGLTLYIDPVMERKEEDKGRKESDTIIRISVRADNGTYYGYLVAKGWVEVYYLDRGKWSKASIKDVAYEGYGTYKLTLDEDLIEGTRILVVASDERGILVLGQVTLRRGD